MNPKKAKDLIPTTAEELGLEEVFLKDLISFYWKEIRKALSDMKGVNVYVHGLGTFTVKHWKIDDYIERYNRILKYYDEQQDLSFRQFAGRKNIEEELKRITVLKEAVEEESERKKLIKQKRDEYISKNQTDLPESEEDS